MPNNNPYAIAPDRAREGRTDGASQHEKSLETRRGRGRPKGSKTIAKGILQKHVAEEMLGIIRPLLPTSEYEEVRAAIKSGKSISTLKEVKIMMALMSPPIWQRLVEESRKPQSDIDSELEGEIVQETQSPEFARDTNERIKVFAALAGLAAKLEEKIDEGTDTKTEPLSEQFKKRGLNLDRFTITGSFGPGSVGRDGGGFGGDSDNPRTVSNQLLTGLESSEDSEEIEAVRLLDTDID